ncbi:hypothetical protein [Streptomyces sp. CB02261]|uniref:hypothetical protein n=1 Tax=Streptomyces sp. CB02261 TaxID=1703940 RepID=UPI00093FA01A|nr:hypothetical protein [Streptomyces sp. CB02261]OKJ52548.1 hypothetical protein AMK29_30435 [Streptomyces sp. CB02261]
MTDLTYTRLTHAIASLEKNIARDSDEIQVRAQFMDVIAQDTARVAEMIGAMNVDSETVGETKELARILHGLSEATLAYAASADTTAKSAHAVGEQARTTHAGIDEAVSRATVDVSEVHRDWFRQE